MKIKSTTERSTQHLVPIPAGLEPKDDKQARLAAWLLRETAMYPERLERGYWIPMSRKEGRLRFGSDWCHVIARAVSSGLAERHDSYFAGDHKKEGYPKAVRLSREYRSGRVVLHTLQRKPRSSRRFEQWRRSNLGPTGCWLADWLSTFKLEDSVEPSDFWQAYAIARIGSGEHFAKRCDYGRLHTTITCLSSQLRGRLTSSATDQPLWSVDVVACQMALLDALIRERKISFRMLTDSEDPYEEILESCRRAKPFRRWNDGQQQTIDPSSWSRVDAKQSLIRAVFARTPQMRVEPAFMALRNAFPIHADYLMEAKRKDHRRVACDLQRRESGIMIDQVCSALAEQHPHEPIATIHDELILTSKTVELAVEIIRKAFRQKGVSTHPNTQAASQPEHLSPDSRSSELQPHYHLAHPKEWGPR